jgi:imidazolonepropionase-like amidohydrolase
MRNSRKIILAAATFVLLCAALRSPVPAGAQRGRPGGGIDVYAITNARIVTVSGPVIERGTVVIRDGLIAAVGAGVNAPPDARTIDGAGLTVYPGLIDAGTTLGIPRPTPTPGAAQGGGGGGFAGLFGQTAPSATSPNSTQLPGLQPEILAADIIRPGGAEIEAARNSGITAAQTAPRGNVFLGQSAVINLAGDSPQQMIVRSPVALYIGLNPLGQGQYPGSLMGVFASVRQMLLDARRFREANEIYERNPRGLRRPEQDKSLAALLPVLARQQPVVMQADREREIERALDLAQEFNLQLVINGGQEADRLAARLKAANVPVLLSLNFPRRTAAASPEADAEPLRVLRERVEAPKTAGRLAAAGVRFAFQSGGLTSMSDFLANAVRATDNGLSRDDAVRAMTLHSAEILGVANQLGSIEVGKIANLTITRGDLFDKNRRIAHVFIDGRPVELRPAAAATGGAGVSGTWALNVNLGGSGNERQEMSASLTLQQQSDRLTGSLQGQLGSGNIASGSVSGADLNFTVPITLPAPASQTTDAIFTGTIAGGEMRGTVQIVGRGTGTFTATRTGGAPAPPGGATAPQGGTTPPGAATPPGGTTPPRTATGTGSPAGEGARANISGTWSVEFNLGPRVLPATLIFEQQGASLSGSLSSRLGTSATSNRTVNGDGFSFTTTVALHDNVEFTGTVNGNRMQGTATQPNGTASFTGTRNP